MDYLAAAPRYGACQPTSSLISTRTLTDRFARIASARCGLVVSRRIPHAVKGGRLSVLFAAPRGGSSPALKNKNAGGALQKNPKEQAHQPDEFDENLTKAEASEKIEEMKALLRR